MSHKRNLKCVSVYLSEEEYKELKAEADEYAVTLSAAIRSKLGLPRIEPGAPMGNQNRTKKQGKKSKGK